MLPGPAAGSGLTVGRTEFFVGVVEAAHAFMFPSTMLSANRLRRRVSNTFAVNRWMMDSGAFTEIARHGGYRHSVGQYAETIRRFAHNGTLVAAAAQDWMCEPFVLSITGLSVAKHQQMTIERYDALMDEDRAGVAIMPVLQGYTLAEYLHHIDDYGDRLQDGMRVAVGSVCKRNRDAAGTAELLTRIKAHAPELRLHGFGIKQTTLARSDVRQALDSADSTAWSFAARYEGRNANDPREAWPWIVRMKEAANAADLTG